MSDRRARELALDPRSSFIVQAPAGSGKTELLIQRYLTLLATVEEPEQVVAITFTRKAAAEMRNRILRALAAAAEGRKLERPHDAATLALARAVLGRGESRAWSLLVNPSRLRIETLDAFNGRLARQLPTLSGGAAGAGVTEDATALYRLAAERTVAELAGGDELGESLRALLRTFDNAVDRLEALLAELLPKREQWLPHLAGRSAAELRRDLELALRRLVAEELERAAAALPAAIRRELLPLLAHAARHAGSAESLDALAAWADAEADGDDRLGSLEAWKGIAHLLLTKQGEWRRKLDRNVGFGPAHAQERARLLDVLDAVGGDEPLRLALASVRELPEPRYSEEQWRSMAALRVVLRHLAAELRVVFAERQQVDFIEVALAAQQALGRADAPSELLLALDRRIQHVLVDEFQDTSRSQLRLLELLTSGWEPGDGRTLFLVGDPMQSIYRFRDADVSLFLRVRRDGIGTVRCRDLTLTRNFRSAPAVVDWINDTFAAVFPAADDIGSGAARFTACEAAREAVDGAGVHVHALAGGDAGDELAETIAVIERERRRGPDQSIAVLVQSRAHLAGLHEQLRARGLEVHAVEIDPLHERQPVQDLIGLTRALTHLADRVAWLGVLRAPWCGIGWRDLHALCGPEREPTIWELLHDAAALERVQEHARRRLAALTAKLRCAFDARSAHAFARWIEETWIALDGPACLDSEDDRRDVQQFFSTLRGAARRGDLDDPAALEAAFARAFARPATDGDSGVEIMTIHRAKGLEFDTVILFGLGREPRRDEQKALYWMERVANDGSDDLIMAPLPPPGREERLTRLVKRAEEARELAERARLLYVAATRARERLHLVCRVEPDTKTPSARTLLRHLWPRFAERFAERPAGGEAENDGAAAPPPAESVQPVLRRLADGYGETADGARMPPVLPAPALPADEEPRPEFEWARHPAMQVGTVVHRYLQRMADDGGAWDAARLRAAIDPIRRELTLLGLSHDEAIAGAERVCRALREVLDDPRGRWILARHEDARSELRLTLNGGHALLHLRIDRTFVDEEGVRWIIDFKTGSHEGGDLEAFLDAEVERYRPQLGRYASALAEIDARPIRLGLYFPLLRAFRSWSPDGGADLR